MCGKRMPKKENGCKRIPENTHNMLSDLVTICTCSAKLFICLQVFGLFGPRCLGLNTASNAFLKTLPNAISGK